MRPFARGGAAGERKEKAAQQAASLARRVVLHAGQSRSDAALGGEELLQQSGERGVECGLPFLQGRGRVKSRSLITIAGIGSTSQNAQAANQLIDGAHLIFYVGFVATEALRSFTRGIHHLVRVAALKRLRTHVDDGGAASLGDRRRETTACQDVQVLSLEQRRQPRLDMFAVVLGRGCVSVAARVRTCSDDVFSPVLGATQSVGTTIRVWSWSIDC